MLKPPTYIYTSSNDYINNLEFEYFETYSFQRGHEFEEKKKALTLEYIELTKLEKTKIGRTAIEDARLAELTAEINGQQKMIIENGQFHYTSQKMNSFRSTDTETDRLKNILRSEIVHIPAWLCAPFYRDAIVFYNLHGEIVSALNICLSCEYMQIGSFHFINADGKNYKLLSGFFKEIGHKIE